MRIIGDDMIELKNISKKFNNQIIFEQANLLLEENKISVLVGKSGEGKSTLFRMIMNLEKFDEGEIQSKEDIKIGMVFQNYELYPHLSVLNNLVLPQKIIQKRTRKAAITKATRIMKDLDIEYLLDKTITTLSGGECQRLAIARTLVMDNNVLLMDEPTSALDQENTDNLVQLLQKLVKTTTIFIITHDTLFAKKVADNIYKISNNKIVKHNLI